MFIYSILYVSYGLVILVIVIIHSPSWGQSSALSPLLDFLLIFPLNWRELISEFSFLFFFLHVGFWATVITVGYFGVRKVISLL